MKQKQRVKFSETIEFSHCTTEMLSDRHELFDDIKEGIVVTAIHTFNGVRNEKDLSFEHGDIIKILALIPEDPKWASAELNKRRGFVPLSYVKPITWFHGKISREQAEYLLKDTTEGSYLVRESTHFPGDYTLCVKSDVKIENYRIKRVSSPHPMYTIDDETKFSNLIKLIAYYTKTKELACLLRTAIKCVKRVDNEDYQLQISSNSSIIEFSQVEFGKVIGTGEFGAVYKGSYNNADVAIKAIKDQTTIKEFFKEAAVMATLKHANLVKLIGIVFSQDRKEIYLVTEYMPKGSLLDYLMCRGRNLLTKKDLILISVNICDGMSYLEEKGIVHRDLAASNVLIADDNIAKVSDFGLAKKIMDEIQSAGRIRIKWTAPEAIKDKIFSNKSDMWSFGILLWEIFSFGRVPYPRIPVNDVLSYVSHGGQMEKPEGCPDEIYKLMRHAWNLDPTLRPTFKETLVKLKDIQCLYANSQD